MACCIIKMIMAHGVLAGWHISRHNGQRSVGKVLDKEEVVFTYSLEVVYTYYILKILLGYSSHDMNSSLVMLFFLLLLFFPQSIWNRLWMEARGPSRS